MDSTDFRGLTSAETQRQREINWTGLHYRQNLLPETAPDNYVILNNVKNHFVFSSNPVILSSIFSFLPLRLFRCKGNNIVRLCITITGDLS